MFLEGIHILNRLKIDDNLTRSPEIPRCIKYLMNKMMNDCETVMCSP